MHRFKTYSDFLVPLFVLVLTAVSAYSSFRSKVSADNKMIKVNIGLVPILQGHIGRGISILTTDCIKSAVTFNFSSEFYKDLIFASKHIVAFSDIEREAGESI